MDVYFTYESAECNQYQEGPGKKREMVTKVIAPLRVEGVDTDRLKVVSGCSMFMSCKSERCYYSSKAREKPKLKTKKPKTK